MEEYRVKADTDPQRMAGGIAHGLRTHRELRMVAIGVQAVHVAVKSVAIARGYLMTQGLDLRMAPGFRSVVFRETGEERVATTLDLELIGDGHAVDTDEYEWTEV